MANDYTKEIELITRNMDLERCIGMVFCNIEVIECEISKTALERDFIKVEISMKEISNLTIVKDKELCI